MTSMFPGVAHNENAIRLFARVLGEAVHDAFHEYIGDAQILHFWDDDSLFFPAGGWSALGESANNQDELDLLTQSLFSAGFLGSISLLRPHLTEFLGQISNWESQEPRGISQSWEDILQGDESSRGVLDIADRLAKQVENADESNIKTLLDDIGRLDYLGFMRIESLAGSWQSRLRRLLDQRLIDMSFHGPSLQRCRVMPEYQRIVLEIDKRRRGTKPLATAIDAAALASLIAMRRTGSQLSPPVYPRFFTSSRTIKSLYASTPWLQHSLQFTVPGSSYLGSAWRTSAYYFVRAVFPELRLNAGASLDAASEARDSAGLRDLAELHVRLESALAGGGTKAVEQAMRVELLRGGTLADRLEDLQKTRLSRIWASYDPSGLPRKLVDDLAALLSLAREDATRAATERRAVSIESQVKEQIDDYRVAVDVVDALDDRVGRYVLTRGKSALSLSSDFGGVRWGFLLDSDGDELPLLEQVIHPTEVRRIAKSVEADASAAEVERAAAVMLGIDAFELAGRILARPRPAATEAHWIMQLVSILEQGRSFSERELDFYASQLFERWDALSPDLQVRYCLGYGHAMFSIWTRSASGGAWRHGDEPVLDHRVEWCISIVQGSVSRMTDIAQLYAVNHLIYTRAISRSIDSSIRDLLSDFETIAVARDDFRFLDTAGVALLGLSVASIEVESTMANDLYERAGVYLRRARVLAPDDTGILQHFDSWSRRTFA